MSKQMIWGLATLILLLGIATVFIFLDQNAELRQLEQETADSTKQLEERNNPQMVDVSDLQRQPPPVKRAKRSIGTAINGNLKPNLHHNNRHLRD